MTSSANQPFPAAIQLFIDSSKQEAEEVVRRTGIKISARLVDMSPIGNPDIWQVNQTASAYNDAVREHNAALRDDPANLTKSGRLKRGLRVNDSMDIKMPDGYVGAASRTTGMWVLIASLPNPTIPLMLPVRVQTLAEWRFSRCSGWGRSARFTSPITCPTPEPRKRATQDRRRAAWCELLRWMPPSTFVRQ